MPYTEDGTGFQATDTSYEAAQAAEQSAPTIRAKILAEMKRTRHGYSVDEMAKTLGLSPFSIRPRMTELKNAGEIQDSGMRMLGDSGRKQAVMVLA